jgi:hypothetical protein
MNYLEYLRFNINEKAAKRLFKEIDSSNNKLISFEEFKLKLIGDRADL